MTMNTEVIKAYTEKNEYLRDKLFYKGFLITDDKLIDSSQYPFYNKWKTVELSEKYVLLYHPQLTVYTVKDKAGSSLCLLGHAFNPFSGVYSEDEILCELVNVINQKEAFFSKINELTGVFYLSAVIHDDLYSLTDAVGLQTAFYSEGQNKTYISSHSNLIGDILHLSESRYIKQLKACKTFHYFGNQLPGNITQFSEVKRLNPNHYLKTGTVSEQIRFYHPKYQKTDNDNICARLTDVLCRTMEIIPKKWQHPAISLTGGCDSRTTLACASKNYGDYAFFSYISQENERPDAEAASDICKKLSLPHVIYNIPENDSEIDGIEGIRAVLLWNGGNVRYNNPNDVRKRAVLDKTFDYDVEVKSWASEVGRARYTKRYNGRRSFGRKPTPRKCTTFYKFLLFNRLIVRKTDKVFREYLQKYFEPDPVCPVPWQDQFYWEWHWPSRDGICLSCEQRFSNEITVPYNNRLILELFLSVSEEDRIKDKMYSDIRRKLDERIDEAADAVVDVNHTNKRAVFENLYYILNRLLLF